MIQNTPVRAAALVGLAGAAVLTGCAGETDADAREPVAYVDGDYTAQGSYQTPESLEQVTVSLTLEGGIVTAVEVSGDPQAPESRQFQGAFIGGIEAEVVGKALDEIAVHRVAGSSLTSGGFHRALDEIKAQASS